MWNSNTSKAESCHVNTWFSKSRGDYSFQTGQWSLYKERELKLWYFVNHPEKCYAHIWNQVNWFLSSCLAIPRLSAKRDAGSLWGRQFNQLGVLTGSANWIDSYPSAPPKSQTKSRIRPWLVDFLMVNIQFCKFPSTYTEQLRRWSNCYRWTYNDFLLKLLFSP